uniref:Uncharacterized protein n=1 Tax=Steinernema glaseri TaxID=37863 RepID=A0A1I8AUN1_9BILA
MFRSSVEELRVGLTAVSQTKPTNRRPFDVTDVILRQGNDDMIRGFHFQLCGTKVVTGKTEEQENFDVWSKNVNFGINCRAQWKDCHSMETQTAARYIICLSITP